MCSFKMFSDKVFQIAFLISLITHGIILFQSSNLTPHTLNKREEPQVSYVKNTESLKEDSKPITLNKDLLSKLPSRIIATKTIPPPFIDKENIFQKNKDSTLRDFHLTKPTFIKPDIIAIKKKITLPPIGIDKIKNPSYLNYYQIVREKIRRAAYQNYSRAEVGEIYLSFIISSDGYLKEVRLIEEKSSPSSYLRNIALRSMKDASPFPDFPKALDYPQLSFNVVISFEIE